MPNNLDKMGLRNALNEKSKPFELIHSVFVERCFKCRTRSLDSIILYVFYERLNLWLLVGDALTIDLKD